MEIKQISKEINANNVAKGFWDTPRNMGEVLMLCVSELSEALEAHRKSKRANPDDVSWCLSTVDEHHFIDEFREKVKDTFEDEIADTVIRLFDLCEGFDIDLESHIQAKLRYNKTRERMHGKAY